jgi:excisionase family DNA binding protein
MTAPPYQSIPDAAAYMGISTRTLYRLVTTGHVRLVHVSAGRRVLRTAALDAYMAGREGRRTRRRVP